MKGTGAVNMYGRYIVICCLIVSSHLHAECDAKRYNQSSQSQFEHAIKELPKLGLLGNEKVLDIGSGDGYLSSFIAKEFLDQGKLVGIDNSHEMVSFAVSKNNNPNITYHHADVCEYNVPNEYDAIVSFWTLHWVTNQYEKALKNIAALLRPGGKALLVHGVGSPLLRTIALNLLDTEKWNAYKKDATILTYPSLSDVALAIENSGLYIENLEVKNNGIWMAREKIIENWLSLSMYNFLPTNLQEQYCNEILDQFIQTYPSNDNGEIWRCSTVVVMVLSKK